MPESTSGPSGQRPRNGFRQKKESSEVLRGRLDAASRTFEENFSEYMRYNRSLKYFRAIILIFALAYLAQLTLIRDFTAGTANALAALSAVAVIASVLDFIIGRKQYRIYLELIVKERYERERQLESDNGAREGEA